MPGVVGAPMPTAAAGNLKLKLQLEISVDT